MLCEHKWKKGLVVFVNGEPKIKTKCIICGEEIIVDFKKDSIFVKQDKNEMEEFLRVSKRRNR